MHLQQTRDHETLARDLETPPFTSLLADVKSHNAALQRFSDWGQIAALLGSRSTQLSDKDQVLRPILAEHRRTQNPRFLVVLTLLMWPLLCGLHRRTRNWDRDAEERWQNLSLCFLKTIDSFDVSRRPDRLMPAIYFRALSQLHRLYKHEWKQSVAQVREPAQLDRSVPQSDPGLAQVEHRDTLDAVEAGYRRRASEGVISHEDADLLIATRIRGESLRDYSPPHRPAVRNRQIPSVASRAGNPSAPLSLRRKSVRRPPLGLQRDTPAADAHNCMTAAGASRPFPHHAFLTVVGHAPRSHLPGFFTESKPNGQEDRRPQTRTRHDCTDREDYRPTWTRSNSLLKNTVIVTCLNWKESPLNLS